MPRNIVVVDDEKLIREILKRAFAQEGYTVTEFENGEDALEYVKKNMVELVLTDIVMPKMHGTHLSTAIKKFDPFIQVIMVTGYPKLDDISAMLEAGVSDFITKPFDIDNIRQIVKETFTRIDRWKELRKQWLSYKRDVGDYRERMIHGPDTGG